MGHQRGRRRAGKLQGDGGVPLVVVERREMLRSAKFWRRPAVAEAEMGGLGGSLSSME